MTDRAPTRDQALPPLRTVGVFFGALLVPVVGSFALPERLAGLAAILWLAALAPTLLLALHWGWRGVFHSVLVSAAVLTATLAILTLLSREVPALLVWVVVAFAAIAAGIGQLSHLLHRQRRDIQDLALTDNLTRLPNRRHARAFLENEFAAAARGRLLSVVLFDLDGFKVFNDLHGHRAGDHALQRFGEILAATTRRMNLSSRFGGEEFLTVLSGTDEAGAVAFADRVRLALESVRLAQGSLTVSGGVASYHPSMAGPDELIAAADLALYRAKSDGRNCVRVFGRSLKPRADAEGLKKTSEAEGRSDDGSRSRAGDYPRPDDEIGRSPPAVSLLPQGDQEDQAGLEPPLSIEPSLLEAVRTLAGEVESRDSTKDGHSARVAAYSDTIARAAELVPVHVNPDVLRLACELHDIGKIGMPEAVLTKAGPLTREEQRHVQMHTVIGATIVESFVAHPTLTAVVRWHHERWDGGGYPDRLAGESVPTAARIVAIADALDALTSDRAHRGSLSWQEAVELIIDLAGSQFDPDLIDRFRISLEELESIHREAVRTAPAG